MIESTLIEIAVAALIWSLTFVIPFRTIQAKPEMRWDIIAVVFSFVLTIVIFDLLDRSADWVAPGLAAWHSEADAWPWWTLLIGYLVLADFGAYWAHRLLHTRVLWSTHAFHHSARHLNVLAGLRASPVHLAMFLAPPMIAFWVFPFPEFGAIGLAVFLLQIVNQHYLHSNLRFPMQRMLEKAVVTPRMHFVHHSANRQFSDSNFGFVLSVWDHLFGTFTDPDSVPADDALGLDDDYSRWRMLFGIPPPAPGETDSTSVPGND
jgi:sterol desaturase/sphingolipid hydroxylase (fatty acid hydroxylase superfamily)